MCYYSSRARSFSVLLSVSVIPVERSCPSHRPMTHQTLWDGRRGQRGPWTQHTSVSLGVPAKFSISFWLDTTLCLMIYFFPALPAFQGLTMQRGSFKSAIHCSLTGLKRHCRSIWLWAIVDPVRPFLFFLWGCLSFPQLTLSRSSCALHTQVPGVLLRGQRCIHRHNDKSLWERHRCQDKYILWSPF